ncbi:MAG: aldose 1-epimerase [Haloplasmataceae bacterium]|nr:aldose 1-epimerase [Haloplasmataceae bacterium]
MIKEFTLRNDQIEVSFINLGASITKFVDLASGVNIIVSHHDYNSYKKNKGSMNSIIGRHAGRIVDFNLDGKDYLVTKNVKNLYQLHGGKNGFHYKYFDALVKDDQITFSITSPENEGGFPGEVKLSITYKLVNDELHLLYEAVSTKKTIMSFTNHAYFNLNGNVSDRVLNHKLYLNADYFIELDQNLIPLRKASVKNTPLDFTTMKKIGLDINQDFEQIKITGGFDHPFLITKLDGITHAATVISEDTHLRLDVYSDQDVIVCYTGNFMDESFVVNDGARGKKQGAICLETQGVPNSINMEEFKNRNIYAANEVYKQTTIWKLHKK